MTLCEELTDYWRVRCPKRGSIYVPRDGRWTYDGNAASPTFSPSLRVTTGSEQDYLFITSGQVQYLDDCTHEWAGHTFDLVPLDEGGRG